jgi:putative restriction endonuclease
MVFFIGNTDYNWFTYLKSINPEDVNFWQPGGNMRFRAIPQNAPFLFRLKSPINKIGGVGFFSSQSLLPVDFAWEVFQERNGTGTYDEFYRKIDSYRKKENKLNIYPTIGCIVLTSPIFFNESDWIPTPSNWSINIVQGKTYSMESDIGNQLWQKVEALVSKYRIIGQHEFEQRLSVLDDSGLPRYGKDSLYKPRLGQGAFRVLVTDTYSRKCAISGEKTLPVLEAAHIKPYEKSGPHAISNGLLLRSDIHKLFDKGYLTITPDYHIEVSKRIKEQFENGRDYYKFHGNNLVTLPSLSNQKPGKEFIDWHNSNVYKG